MSEDMSMAAKTERTNEARPRRCMKCGKRFETRQSKCPYCGGRLTEDRPENKKQYLED